MSYIAHSYRSSYELFYIKTHDVFVVTISGLNDTKNWQLDTRCTLFLLSNKTIADISKQELALLAKARGSKIEPRPGPEPGIIKRGQESKNSCRRKTRPQVGHARLAGRSRKVHEASSLCTQ